jgi:DNA modification methylase
MVTTRACPASHVLAIEHIAPATLKPDPRNARTHSKRQIRQITASIREFGWTNPMLIDENNRVIAGHGRLAAAERLGMTEVPIIRLKGLSEPQKRALALADNKLAENAGWNPEILTQELQYLSEIEIDFDVEITGFSTGEIDLLIGDTAAEDDAADRVPAVPVDESSCIQYGDLWHLGRHRLLCGDATNPHDYERLLGPDRARMVFTDPPYNVPIDGHVSGLGRIKHREFAMASGEMSEAQFTAFLETAFAHLARVSLDGSIHCIFMDWRHMREILTAGAAAYTELKNLCVWAKSNAGMGTFYRSQHELVFVFKSGRRPHINTFELGQHGRHRSNVWTYSGVNGFGSERLEELALHPTVKPVALVADAILDCSKRGDIVLDPFLGSGTTLIAAERSGRRAYAMELDPCYVETAIRRWQDYTGERAVHVGTGLGLSDLHQLRSHPPTSKKPRLRIRSGSSRIEGSTDGR